MRKAIFTSLALKTLLDEAAARLPSQSRGILCSQGNFGPISHIHFLEDNAQRTTTKVTEIFSKYGDFYSDDKGFYSSPQELIDLHRKMSSTRLVMCGIFHVHLVTPPEPTKIDIELCRSKVSGYSDLIYAILSFAAPKPALGVFQIHEDHVTRLEYEEKFEMIIDSQPMALT